MYYSFVLLCMAVFSFSWHTAGADLSIGSDRLSVELFIKENNPAKALALINKKGTATNQNNQSNSLPATAENTG